MIEWERGVICEQTPMIMEVLKELSLSNHNVLFEGMMDLSYLSKIADCNQIVYLTVNKELSEHTFFDRESHKGLLDSIMNNPMISEDEKQRRLNMRKRAAIEAFHVDVLKYGIAQFDRTNCTIMEMLQMVEKHFGLPNF